MDSRAPVSTARSSRGGDAELTRTALSPHMETSRSWLISIITVREGQYGTAEKGRSLVRPCSSEISGGSTRERAWGMMHSGTQTAAPCIFEWRLLSCSPTSLEEMNECQPCHRPCHRHEARRTANTKSWMGSCGHIGIRSQTARVNRACDAESLQATEAALAYYAQCHDGLPVWARLEWASQTALHSTLFCVYFSIRMGFVRGMDADWQMKASSAVPCTYYVRTCPVRRWS